MIRRDTPAPPTKPTLRERGLFVAGQADGRSPRRHAALGLSLVETLIVGFAITALALGLVVIGRSVQAVDAEGRTRSILARLTAAAQAYHAAPASPAAVAGTAGSANAEDDDDSATPPARWETADAALRAMRSRPESARTLAGVPIRVEPGRGLIALDGYGRPLRYVPADPTAATPGQFVSAGRDGLFGDEAHAGPTDERRRRARADNHYGAELAPLVPVYPAPGEAPAPVGPPAAVGPVMGLPAEAVPDAAPPAP
jgi:hypothetical protein